MQRRVLLIEDNRDIAALVSLHLADLSCDVDQAADGLVGRRMAREARYDLIILDVMLPGLDGLEVCRCLRAEANHTPILMLTAKSAEVDRVVGLEVGADDYLTKPFSIRELVAWVKAIFRRAEMFAAAGPAPAETLALGELAIDVERRSVTVEGRPVDLTAKEFDLLVQFARHPGRVYSRQQLLDVVWGHGSNSYEHTVNSHINRLRAKIERDPAHPEFVLTVWGVGYKFNDRPAS